MPREGGGTGADAWVRRVEQVQAERDTARAQAERAIETRENANAVSIRVEGENQRLRAQSDALAEALDELLIGGADAVSMEHAKRAAKVVLRSYRKARDAS